MTGCQKCRRVTGKIKAERAINTGGKRRVKNPYYYFFCAPYWRAAYYFLPDDP